MSEYRYALTPFSSRLPDLALENSKSHPQYFGLVVEPLVVIETGDTLIRCAADLSVEDVLAE